jgi:isopenicillin-N epimerase
MANCPPLLPRRYELGYRAEFLWQGTSDFTAWLAAPACLELQRALQPLRVTSYNHSLARQAAQMLLQAWGTNVSLGISADGRTAGLVAIELPWPLNIRSTDSSAGSSTTSAPAVHVAINGVKADSDDSAGTGGSSSKGPMPADAAALNLLLREQYKIEVPVAFVAGRLYTRISAQIYNSIADYERLRDVVSGLRQGARV